jgi:hypothetical protein
VQGIAIRIGGIAALTVGLTLSLSVIAYAGAGDDAHFLVHQQSAPNAGGQVSDTLTCPTGELALGGGVRYFSFPKDIFIRAGGPVNEVNNLLENGGVPHRFKSTVNNLGDQPKTMISYAICSANTDATVVRATTFTALKGAGDFPNGRATATCPAGQVAIGGGVYPENPDYSGFIMANGPVDETSSVSSTFDGDTPRGWLAAARGSEGDTFRVYVICSATSTATIQVESMTLAPNTGAHAGLACPTGQRAISGGVIDDATYAWMVSSAPGNVGSYASSINPGIAAGWHASVWSIVGSNVLFKVAAVCEGPTAPNAPPPVVDPGDPPPPEPPAVVPDTVSNNFKIGRFYRDKEKGRGAIVLNVPGPGSVTLESKKLKYQVNVAARAKDIGLSVLAADGGPRNKLERTGKLKAKVKLTFLPDGGSPSSQKTKLKLIYDG